jgi:MHS family proline/betaine transporter-like MFS transporter
MSATNTRGASGGKESLGFIVGASSVGTLIEWDDFCLCAIVAGLFAEKFSPGDLKTGFLYSLAVFWVGFIVRPFGAAVFGHVGDLIGRKFTPPNKSYTRNKKNGWQSRL